MTRGPILLLAALAAGCASAAGAGDLPRGACVVGGADGVSVLEDGELVLSYRYAGLRVPAIEPLLARGGVPVTDSAAEPGGCVSLWLAHGDVDGHDFWHDPSTRIVNGEAVLCEGGRGRARVRARNLWLVGEEAVLIEDRVIKVSLGEDLRVIDLDLRLSPAGKPITFGDTRDGTLGLRLAPELAPDGGGRLVSSEGAPGAEALGGRARWIACTGTVGGEEVTVALLDHPENLRHPAWWNVRGHGLVAANPFALHGFGGAPPAAGALRLQPSESLRLRYRVLVARGELDVDRVEEAWRELR